MHSIPLFVLLCALHFSSVAQSMLNQKTVWYSPKTTQYVSREDIILESKFIVDKQQTIQWVQKQGLRTYTLTIVGVQSNWTDTGKDGSIRYEVKIKRNRGYIIVGKSNNSLFVQTEFVKNGVNVLPLKFTVDRIEIL